MRIRPTRVDVAVRVEASDVAVWDSGWWVRNVAEAEDQVGLFFGPGGAGGGGLVVFVVSGCVGGGHGVAVGSVVFGMHFRGLCSGWCAGGRHFEVMVIEDVGGHWWNAVLKCVYLCL